MDKFVIQTKCLIDSQFSHSHETDQNLNITNFSVEVMKDDIVVNK